MLFSTPMTADTNPRSRLRAAAAIVLFCLAAMVAGVRTVQHLNVVGDAKAPGDGLIDFRDVLYYPAVSLLSGKNPYDVAIYTKAYPGGRPGLAYPPHSFLFHLPFALLSQRPAEALHFVFNLFASLVLAYLALRLCDLQASTAGIFGLAALLLLSRPGHMTLFAGQCTFYVVAGAYAALFYAHSRPVLASMGFFLVSIKPSLAAPLLFLMLAMRVVRPLVWGSMTALVASAGVSIVLARYAGGFTLLLHSMVNSFRQFELYSGNTETLTVNRIDVAALVGRLTGTPLSTMTAGALDLVILLVGCGCVSRLAKPSSPSRYRLACSIACITLLLSTYHQAYDALLLTLPVLALATDSLPSLRGPRPEVWRYAILGLLLVPAVNYLASHTAGQNLSIGPRTWLLILSLNGAATLLAFLGLALMALRNARDVDAPAPPVSSPSPRQEHQAYCK
jgi:hypothetical protein